MLSTADNKVKTLLSNADAVVAKKASLGKSQEEEERENNFGS